MKYETTEGTGSNINSWS